MFIFMNKASKPRRCHLRAFLKPCLMPSLQSERMKNDVFPKKYPSIEKKVGQSLCIFHILLIFVEQKVRTIKILYLHEKADKIQSCLPGHVPIIR